MSTVTHPTGKRDEVEKWDPEPRWPAAVALLAIGALRFALPSHLSFGPDWLLFAVVSTLLIPTVILHQRGLNQLNQILGYVILVAITADLLVSLGLLVAGLPTKRDSPQDLLWAAGGLWASNILIFANWYWRLDAGGPNKRDIRGVHQCGAFLFPQMVLPPGQQQKRWRPGFVDYLFLAFNASTAFSPTDAPVLSRWAKLMMMVQSMISLGAVVILAARAINVL